MSETVPVYHLTESEFVQVFEIIAKRLHGHSDGGAQLEARANTAVFLSVLNEGTE